ncbi:hypothetical protein LPE509_00861 [Legionella pneumophila subsp. pneumophila LPE509]|nr:hypothetical protein LPE509_00861 [Legionella pneumophila subsp. pneumophila LPE509]
MQPVLYWKLSDLASGIVWVETCEKPHGQGKRLANSNLTNSILYKNK